MSGWIEPDLITELLGMAQPPAPTPFTAATAAGARVWSVNDNIYRPVRAVTEKLPAALYEPGWHDGPFLKQHKLETDVLVDLHDSVTSEIVQEIAEFWELENRFRELGSVHKRGVLLHGEPGTGKTAVAFRITQMACEKNDAIGFVIGNASLAANVLAEFRKIEPKRRIVALLEDIDELLEEDDESQYLALLDGEKQIGNIVFVATTNHFDSLPKRIINRPSRFDIVHCIGGLTTEAREAFLSTKDPSTPEPVLAEMVKRSEGYTIAHLKEMLILVRAYGLSPAKAAARLHEMMQTGSQDEKEDE